MIVRLILPLPTNRHTEAGATHLCFGIENASELKGKIYAYVPYPGRNGVEDRYSGQLAVTDWAILAQPTFIGF